MWFSSSGSTAGSRGLVVGSPGSIGSHIDSYGSRSSVAGSPAGFTWFTWLSCRFTWFTEPRDHELVSDASSLGSLAGSRG